MAAEAVHLSALDDSLGEDAGFEAVLDPELRAFFAEEREAARLGAVFIDFPYLRGFAFKALRYALNWRQPPSVWGDRYHQAAPVALGRALIAAGQEAGGLDAPLGRRLIAKALGFFTHIAVDTETHFHVNRLAGARAAEGGREADHHQTIEKLQSVFFHWDRLGFNFLGRRAVREAIRVEPRWLLEDPRALGAWREAHAALYGAAPSAGELRRWLRGYALYSRVVASFIGARLTTREEEAREYPLVYEGRGFSFPAVYRSSLERCRRYLSVAWAAAQGDPFDERAVPERDIDRPEPIMSAAKPEAAR